MKLALRIQYTVLGLDDGRIRVRFTITTSYGLDGAGIESRWGGEIFRRRPHRPWGPPSLLYNGYRDFYMHGSVHRESNLITVQQDANYSVYYISVGSSTCFGC